MTRKAGMLWWIALGVLGAGCHRVFGVEPPPVDAGPDAATPPDAERRPLCLNDEFDDGVLGPPWINLAPPTPGTVVVEQDGQVVLAIETGVLGFAGIYSERKYDLTGGTVGVEMVQPPAGADVEAYLAAAVDANNYYLIDTYEGRLLLRVAHLGQFTEMELSYSPTSHRFWRLRHDPQAKEIAFEASASGTWVTLLTLPATVPVDGLRVELYMDTWAPGPPLRQTARFDNVQMTGPGCITP